MEKIKPAYIGIAVLVLALIVSNGVTFWALSRRSTVAVNTNLPLTNTANVNSGDPYGVPPVTSTPPLGEIDGTIPQAKELVSIEWASFPAETSVYSFIDYDWMRSRIDTAELRDMWGDLDKYINSLKVYRIGTITEGRFAGKDVYIVRPPQMGMVTSYPLYRVIKIDTKTFVHIASQSQPLSEYDAFAQLMTSDRDIGLKNMEPVTTVSIPNSPILLKRVPMEPYKLITQYEKLTKVFTVNGVDVYKDEIDNCFIVKAADGTAREYYFDTPAFGSLGKDDSYFGAFPSKLEITFTDGSKNQREYTFKYVGGCGARGCYRYAPYITNATTQLKQVGTFANGNPVYELADLKVKATLQSQKPVVEEMYDQFYPGYDEVAQKPKEKKPFSTFLADRPMLYWQDPFGKFIEFRSAEYLPAVECGKPVIYLYPEKTTDVSVWVNPAGGFSVTDPAYNDGWFVRATPASELLNYADGKTYPYLFWEGFGYNYARPNAGAVVARKDVAAYLTTTLAKLGMNKKESADFMEFWVPLMQEKPYYFITFLPQQDFDKVAPLTVSPKPDTVIRVFMDYEGLDEKKYVEPQRIVTPARVGFTVVEWGGALHR